MPKLRWHALLGELPRQSHRPHVSRDLRLALQRLRQVVGHLQPQPHVGGAAEGFGEAEGHFGGDACGAVHELAQGLAADAEGLGPFSDAEAGGLEAVDPDREARMGWVVHGAEGGVGGLGHWGFLVVVGELDLVGAAVLEAEDDAPVGADGDGPEAGAVAGEAVQAVAVQVEVLDVQGEVQALQDEADAVDVAWIEPPHLAPLEQPLQAPVGERADHEGV